jgi:transcriptional regulator with XRE-family HTH domain
MSPNHGEAINAAVAAELRAQRARIGVSYDVLAEQTGLSKSAVFKYLKGTRSIPVPALYDLCDALGIGVDDVFVLAMKVVEKD